ncbi:MAG: hypothetical protein AAFV53_07460 [Myxococcota bacterium]
MWWILLMACVRPAPPDALSTPSAPPAAQTTLELDGPPPIPDALAARLQQYLNVRSASLAALASDGSSVLITTRFGETRQIHAVQQPGGARSQLTFRDEPVSDVSLASGGQQVYYRSDEGGDENYQIFRLDLASGRTTRLTDGTSRHGGYLWNNQGDRFIYTSNARNGRDFDLYLSGPGGEGPPRRCAFGRGGGLLEPAGRLARRSTPAGRRVSLDQ